jgi:AcrR family transcriptional regulator
MPYELEGRTQQKQRTRAALVSAARDLIAQGLSPTVEDAATAASISRTTAYRYFSSQRALLAAAHPETATTSMLPREPPSDPEARLDLVVRAFTQMIVETEPQQRTMLRLSLEADDDERAALPLRQGRAIGWIEEALEPMRDHFDDKQVHRLALAIRSATGIEALAWLTDVAGLSRRDAVGLMRWSARALYRSAVADGATSIPARTAPTSGAVSRPG